MKKPEWGVVLIAAGAVLILSALFLFCRNRAEDAHAGQAAAYAVSQVRSVIEMGGAEVEKPDPGETDAPGAAAGGVIWVEGYDYIGYITIPSLELELPVMAQWDYGRLQLSPCRQFGSAETDDLVIAAHNYESHFGRLNELISGDTVTFTGTDGTVHSYYVSIVRKVEPTHVDEVQDSPYDMVLYTCTVGGQIRVAVFCYRTDGTGAGISPCSKSHAAMSSSV